jgi:drug/metabolite transporter (DMT)-like permease
MLIGGLGMLGFSLTLPMTRIAVAELDPLVVGLGRVLVSALLAALVLRLRGNRFPDLRHLPSLLVVAVGVVVGYPVLTSLAMRHVPSAHGAVVTGLIPLSTASFAVLRAGERPSRGFWLAAAAGSAAVALFALKEGGWNFRGADALLLLAVVTSGLGYAEGGRLAREIGGLQVVGWAMVMAAVLVAVPAVWAAAAHGLHASPRAWAAFGYTGTVSLFFAFWAWYHGLALGGIARVGQLQLPQVFITLGWSALLLGERITPLTLLTSVFVVATVAVGRRTAVAR